LGNVYIALIHHPVVNRAGEVVTSSVTSLDLHDLARAARTYGIAATFVIHPSPAQRRFVSHVVGHFVGGPGRDFHPERGETLEQQVQVAPDLDAVLEAVEAREGVLPTLVGTSAQSGPDLIGFGALRCRLRKATTPSLVLFGTSWGLAPELWNRIDLRLPPVRGETETGYNHLSVRAAVAVILDRLLGDHETPSPSAVKSKECSL
jgi:hypothetical protein